MDDTCIVGSLNYHRSELLPAGCQAITCTTVDYG